MNAKLTRSGSSYVEDDGLVFLAYPIDLRGFLQLDGVATETACREALQATWLRVRRELFDLGADLVQYDVAAVGPWSFLTAVGRKR